MAEKPMPGAGSRLPIKSGIPLKSTAVNKRGGTLAKRLSKSTSDLTKTRGDRMPLLSLRNRAVSTKNLSNTNSTGSTAFVKKRAAAVITGTENQHGGKRPLLMTTQQKESKSQQVGAASSKSLPSKQPVKAKPKPWDLKGHLEAEKERSSVLKAELNNLQHLVPEMEAQSAQLEDLRRKYNIMEREHEKALKELEEKHDLQLANDKLQSELNHAQVSNANLCKEKLEISEEMRVLQTRLANILQHKEQIEGQMVNLQSLLGQSETKCEELNNEILLLKKSLYDHEQMRKVMHNEIMDLKGNIRVYGRVRPTITKEAGQPLYSVEYPSLHKIEIQCLDQKPQKGCAARPPEKKGFKLNRVFSQSSNQEEVFSDVGDLVQSALDGYNVAICAYGITGSGKTYTMDGVEDNSLEKGVIPRSLDCIFNGIKNLEKQGWTYEVRLSCYEIYCEEIKDLINPANPGPHDIRMSNEPHRDLFVTNMTVEVVKDSNDVHEKLSIARKNRHVAATVRNQFSSRSHSITQVELIGENQLRHEKSYGSLYLVDLAGSEKIDDENGVDRKKETTNINLSLTQLRTVILNLSNKKQTKQIDYRSSKLTHLLKPCLGGNAKTLVIVTLSPLNDDYKEALASLRFAVSVSCCKQNAVKSVKKVD